MKSNALYITGSRPVKLRIRFSVPMLIGNVFQQVYNLAYRRADHGL